MDYTKPIEIIDGIYWVGFYDGRTDFACNPYLITDKDSTGNLTEAILVDPGPISHFPIVARKIFNIIDFYKISSIVLQHQDPDICGSLPLFQDLIREGDLSVVAHRRAAALINYYAFKSLNYYYPEDNGLSLSFKSGRKLEFVLAHYLHTPGVINTFDRNNGVLFSSDIFGGFLSKWKLYAEDGYPEKMKEFHEFYMPSKGVVEHYLKKIRQLPLKIICPQHGSVIKNSLVKKCAAALEKFEYGRLING